MTIIKSINTPRRPSGYEFVQMDNKWVLFSDGLTGVYAWDSTTTEPYRVRDLVANLPDNFSSPGKTIEECPYLPAGRFLTRHRERLFMADPIHSKVFYSGTRTDLSTDVGSGAEEERTIRPWELWNLRMDLSRTNPGYGGSMNVGHRSQRITGILSHESGLFIFKESQILLWHWPEDAAPHEVAYGAYLMPIVKDIGLLSHESLAVDGSMMYFIGRRGRSDVAVFRFDGQEIEEISFNIPHRVKHFGDVDLRISRPYGIIHDGYYYIGIDEEGIGEPKFVLAYDLVHRAWIEMDSPTINAVATIPQISGIISGGEDGRIYRYPGTRDFDITPDANVPVWFEYRSREVDAGRRVHDKKFRKLWFNADVKYGDMITRNEVPINVGLEYEDNQEEKEYVVTESSLYDMFLSQRALWAKIRLTGETMNRLVFKNISLAWRSRKDKK